MYLVRVLSAPLLLDIMLCRRDSMRRREDNLVSKFVKSGWKSAVPRPGLGSEGPSACTCERLWRPPRSFRWNHRTGRSGSPATAKLAMDEQFSQLKNLSDLSLNKWLQGCSRRFSVTQVLLSLTAWAHVTLATHMKACWVNNTQLRNSELTRVPNDSVRTLPHRVKKNLQLPSS